MIRLILMTLFFLLSLLTVFKAPTNLLWLVSILVTEFSWVFFCLVAVLLFWRFGAARYNLLISLIGFVSLVLLAIPLIGAFRISGRLNKDFETKFSHTGNATVESVTNAALTTRDTKPFTLWRMLTGINAKQVSYRTLTYDTTKALTLDFYASVTTGKRPCIVVVHGGSWAAGDSRQLPELNSVLAKAGYQVASINYRLAPQSVYPSTLEDVHTALTCLRSHAEDLNIDTNNFVLLGRSAGGQIVLSAAYILQEPGIKGVISFYGPADMVWGYANPTNPLVLNSRKVMKDYLGGSYEQTPKQYVNSSATETVTNHSVPTLLIHGKNDPLVSPGHGERLSPKLDSFGVKHYELYLPWATHGFDWTLNGPGGQLSTWLVLRFLEDVVR